MRILPLITTEKNTGKWETNKKCTKLLNDHSYSLRFTAADQHSLTVI